jgi:hypothetical protein
VDAFVVEYDVAKARGVVADANQLLYMSVWNQPAGGTSVRYYRTAATAYTVPANVAGAPTTLTDAAGEDPALPPARPVSLSRTREDAPASAVFS